MSNIKISSKDKILDTLVSIDNNSDSGYFEVNNSIHDNDRISLLERRGYIKCNNEGTRYYLTESGYSMLQRWYALKATRKLENTIEKTNKDITKSIRDFDNSSTNVSNEMLLHTKVMKNLTWWILGFTILNVFFFVFQILNKVFNWGLF